MEDKAFPRWRYHKTLNARIVKSADENKALGAGWADSPADFEKESYKEHMAQWESKAEKDAIQKSEEKAEVDSVEPVEEQSKKSKKKAKAD